MIDLLQIIYLPVSYTHLDVYKRQEIVRVQFFGKQAAGEIFIDDGACAFEVIALTDDRNAASAAGNDQIAGFYHVPYGADLYDFHWLGGSNHAARCV